MHRITASRSKSTRYLRCGHVRSRVAQSQDYFPMSHPFYSSPGDSLTETIGRWRLPCTPSQALSTLRHPKESAASEPWCTNRTAIPRWAVVGSIERPRGIVPANSKPCNNEVSEAGRNEYHAKSFQPRDDRRQGGTMKLVALRWADKTQQKSTQQ